MTSQGCSSSSNSNKFPDQLEDLRNIMMKIKDLTASFRICFAGDDSRLDSFVYHMNIIFEKQSCVNSRPGGTDDTLGPGLPKTLAVSVGDVAGSVPTVKEELESLNAALKSIKLQVDAFKEVAECGSDLSFLLQKVDTIVATRSPSNFMASSTPQNRKRQNNSNVTVISTGNVACKKPKAAAQTGSFAPNTAKVTSEAKHSSTTRQALGNSEDHIDTIDDVTVETRTFIQHNNANLAKVKIETDHDPPVSVRNPNGIHIKDEISSDSAPETDVEMSDEPSTEQEQQSSEGSADAEVNRGVKERAQVQGVALNSPDEDNPDQQNSGNIFEKDNILTLIFKNLNLQDLKNVRLVNKQCKEIADARFIHEKSWKLVIDKQFRKRYQGKTLEDLNDCIDNSKGRFPLTSLIFACKPPISLVFGCRTVVRNYYDSFTRPSLLRFYSLHGANITTLELRFFQGPVRTLHDLLLNQLPKVEHISIYTMSLRYYSKNEKLLTSREMEPIQLPNLKTIYFKPYTCPCQRGFFKAFLTSAVNLTEIKNVNSYLLPCIDQAGKLDRIKNLLLFPRKHPNDVLSFLKLSELQPELTSLTILPDILTDRFLEFEYITGLNAILESSKDILKMLELPSFFFVPSLVLPNLKNLQLLEMSHFSPVKNLDLEAIFPGNFKLREVFPNVRTVSCILVDIVAIDKRNMSAGGERSSSSSRFDMSRSFPSVTHLKVENFHYFGKALEIYFPMLTHLTCFNFDLTTHNGDHVGARCGLRETTIGLESLVLKGFRFFGEKSRLDELFTGISRLVCVKLNDDDNAPSTLQADYQLLQNLKGLRRLMIVFDHFDNSKLKPSSLSGSKNLVDQPTACAVITPVSYKNAFALMENLEEIIFAYDHYLPAVSDFAKIFHPFAPFPRVKIVHEPNQT